MTWNCHIDDSAKGRYDMILGRDLLIYLGLNITFYDHIIEADDGPFKEYTTTMVDLGSYEFKYFITGKVTPEELFTNAYTEEIHESQQVRISTKKLRVLLDDKY